MSQYNSPDSETGSSRLHCAGNPAISRNIPSSEDPKPPSRNVFARKKTSLMLRGIALFMSVALPTGLLAENTSSLSHEWLTSLQSQLEAMGLQTNAESTSQAVVLSLVKEVDNQARIITGEEWQAAQDRRIGMRLLTGISFGMTNGLPVISAIATNAPAFHIEGMAVGDRITGVGTQLFSKISLPAFQSLLNESDEESVFLHVVHLNETNRIEVRRAPLREPAMALVDLLPNNVGYIKINGLYENSGRDVVSRIRAWSEASRDGIILDLRGAGGYDTACVTQIASLFGQAGQFLFAFRDLHQQDLEVIKALDGRPVSIPLMVLIDINTTGASEVLAAVLNGTARQTLLIGEATAGNFTLRENVEVSGHQILAAVKVLDTADGIRYNGKFGVQPTVTVEGIYRDTHDYEPPVDLLDHRETLEEEARDLETRRRVRGDGVLERAIDILTGLKSLNKADIKLSSPDSI